MTPTQRSLKLLRELGYTAQVVEKWNPHAKVRQDLFDCIDIVACGNGRCLGVQATSGSNVSKRIEKAIEEPRLKVWLEVPSHSFEVWGWRKLKRTRKVEVRRVRISWHSFEFDIQEVTECPTA